MIESNLINHKQVELIHDIIDMNNFSDADGSLMKHKLTEAITLIQDRLTEEGKTVTITDDTLFDYKVFQFLTQANDELALNLDTDTYTIDISNTSDTHVVKNADDGTVTIGSTIT